MLFQVLDDDFTLANLVLGITQLVVSATDARIQVIACQNQDGDNPYPEHEDDECADGAVQHIVAGEVGNVGVETHRTQYKQGSGQNDTRTENDKFTVFLTIRPRKLELFAVLFVEPDIAEIIEQ